MMAELSGGGLGDGSRRNLGMFLQVFNDLCVHAFSIVPFYLLLCNELGNVLGLLLPTPFVRFCHLRIETLGLL